MSFYDEIDYGQYNVVQLVVTFCFVFFYSVSFVFLCDIYLFIFSAVKLNIFLFF